MDIYTFFVTLHIVGTILGTGGATIAEVQITKALKDKKVSDDEKQLMHANYFMIRVGLAFIIFSALAMMWYFWQNGMTDRIFGDKLLFKDLLVVIIIINAVAISKRWVPLWLGAATSFTAWWMATLLGAAGYLPYSFLTYLLAFVILVFSVAGVLHLIKKFFVFRK